LSPLSSGFVTLKIKPLAMPSAHLRKGFRHKESKHNHDETSSNLDSAAPPQSRVPDMHSVRAVQPNKDRSHSLAVATASAHSVAIVSTMATPAASAFEATTCSAAPASAVRRPVGPATSAAHPDSREARNSD